MKQRWVWGDNGPLELGIGLVGGMTTPALATQDGTGSWQQIEFGAYHAAGIKEDGSLWTWGTNTYGELGRAGDTSIPGQVSGAWKHVACGSSFTIGIKSDGSMWAWGLNSAGQLGIGSTANKTTPTRVGVATNWRKSSCGWTHAAAITDSGGLYTWGDNSYGALGSGSWLPAYVTSPLNINLTNLGWSQAVDIACGSYFTLATDGVSLRCAGNNTYGQLGNNAVGIHSEYFVAPVFAGSGVRAVFAGESHAACILNTGALYTWGYNFYGQLGLGNTTDRYSPVQVSGMWITAALGGWSSYGIKTVNPLEGSLWSWGTNSNHELGLGHTTQMNSPTQVGTATKWANVAASFSNGSALYFSTVWANFKGQYEA